MSELRYSSLNKEWVIIATDRAKRPEDFKYGKGVPPADSREKCPFCPGHESKTPPEVFCLREKGTAPNTSGWRVRVIPNQFPALTPEGNHKRHPINDIYMSMDGFGAHEVIVENPDHDQNLTTMDIRQVEEVFSVYRERYIALSADRRYESVILFKNNGPGAGTSLSHPHSQIIAMPVTPLMLRHRLDVAREYFDNYGDCIYCHMLEKERETKDRLVLESDNFVVIELFASFFAFETAVYPKWHASNFGAITPEQCRELAGVMQKLLIKLKRALDNPDYNIMVASAPAHEQDLEYYHWFIKIVPRISKAAGFELGSGVFINTVVPEAAAKYLRDA
jgi:UDPglucose--hexose-1-phosphate uridylyltransferase